MILWIAIGITVINLLSLLFFFGLLRDVKEVIKSGEWAIGVKNSSIFYTKRLYHFKILYFVLTLLLMIGSYVFLLEL